tara:strand:+ start:494 stop:787 length:294 start_codon:yes stop_codon:yes gene_type:complete
MNDYYGDMHYKHDKIKSDLENTELKEKYSEKLIDQLIKGKVYSYPGYFTFHREFIIKEYQTLYSNYMDVVNKKLKTFHCLRSKGMPDDIIEIILQSL